MSLSFDEQTVGGVLAGRVNGAFQLKGNMTVWNGRTADSELQHIAAVEPSPEIMDWRQP